MPVNFRIGTFNVQNLFERAKIFNISNTNVVSRNLDDLATLQKELRKNTYDKAKILRLINRLSRFIKINETRGRLLGRRGGQRAVVANGRRDWDGFIEFKRSKFNNVTQKNIAKVIRTVNADVLGVVEAEDRLVLKRFDSDRLGNRDYDFNMLIDGNDQRGIDVGLYSRFPVGGVWTHIFDPVGQPPVFSRDCLEVELLLPNGESLWVLVNHFKSKFGGDTPASQSRRKAQADRVAEILRNDYDLRRDLVCVVGDFNDTPNSAPLRDLLRMQRLHDVLAMEFPNSPGNRWTYRYRNNNQQIDYVLVSDPLRDAFQQASVERRGMFTNGVTTPFSTVTSWRNAASDHAAVWADFSL